MVNHHVLYSKGHVGGYKPHFDTNPYDYACLYDNMVVYSFVVYKYRIVSDYIGP